MTKTNNPKNSSKKKIINAIITVVVTIVFIIALVCLGYVCFQTIRGKETNLFGYKMYYVLTDSMSPTIEEGEMILSNLVTDTDNYLKVDKQINEGDVITFTTTLSNGTEITNTHRVIKDVYYDSSKGAYCVVTKGDNPNATADQPTPISKIQARMIRKVAGIDSIYSFLRSTAGIAVMILIPMGLMLISIIYQLVVKIKKPATDEKPKYLSDEEKERIRKEKEEEIKRQAIEEYKVLEAQKQAIKEAAIKEYLESQKPDSKE